MLEINVHDDVAEKYPNYKKNFKNVDEFITFLMADVIGDNSMFGYTIKRLENGDKLPIPKGTARNLGGSGAPPVP